MDSSHGTGLTVTFVAPLSKVNNKQGNHKMHFKTSWVGLECIFKGSAPVNWSRA